MRIFIAILIIACASVLTSCGDGSEYGSRAARQLQAAWGSPEAIVKVASDYKATSDSLGNPSSMATAFINACSGNDSMKIVAQAIALTPQEMGREMGNAIVDGLAGSSMDANDASAQLNLINYAYALLLRSEDLSVCYNAIDEAVISLPEEKQMLVYAHSCSPEVLARAMKQECDSIDATAAARRVKIVETILTGEDLKKFQSIYYSK